MRVLPDCAGAFAPVENALADTFLPSLFKGSTPSWDLTSLPVRHGGLGIPDPTKAAEIHFDTSTEMTVDLTRSLKSNTPLNAAAFRDSSAVKIRNNRKIQLARHKRQLADVLAASSTEAKRRIFRSEDTGVWLTAVPSSDYGTDLSMTEFRDSLRLRFGQRPHGLPKKCDGCKSVDFSVGHAQQCKKGGLVRGRHEDVCAEWGNLCSLALNPSSVVDEPIIPLYQPDEGTNAMEQSQLRGDISARSFWSRGVTAVFDVRIGDTDCASSRRMNPHAVLKRHEDEKKKKYGEACARSQLHFTPLVFSVDGLEGTEAKAARKRLASRLAAKWGRQYSQVCGFVRARIAFTLVRAASRCLRGTRDPYTRKPNLDWASMSGMRLYSNCSNSIAICASNPCAFCDLLLELITTFI